MEIFDEFYKDVESLLPKSDNLVIFGSFSNLLWARKKYLEFFENILSKFPEKNIFIPAYTYCSRRGSVFSEKLKPDPQNGALSRVIFESTINDSRMFRTYDEDFSYLIYKQKEFKNESIFHRKNKSFGKDSHHQDLFSLNPIFIKMAVGLQDGFTPAMHTEALAVVPYRKYIELNPNNPKFYYARVEDYGNKESFKVNRTKILSILTRNVDYVSHVKSNCEAVAIWSESFLEKSVRYLKTDPEFYRE